MEISLVEIETPVTWDEELIEYQASIFLSSLWLQSVATQSRVPVFFKFFADYKEIARISGLMICPAADKLKLLFFYSGIVSKLRDPEIISKCRLALLNYARTNGISRIIIRSYDDKNCTQTRLPAFKINKRVEYVICLERDKDMILEGFHRSARRVVRKARTAGVSVGISKSVQLYDLLFEMMTETRHRRKRKGYGDYNALSIPFFDRSAMLNLLKEDKASLFYAEDKEGILSVVYIFHHINVSYAILTGTTARGYELDVSACLLYEIAITLKDKGCRYLNLGGVPSGKKNSGIVQFKKSLGTDVVESCEESTNFILFPWTLFNPLLFLRRKLPDRPFFRFCKKAMRKFMEIILTPDSSVL